ncbi:MAG: hypothetical protein EP343_14525 [Deltaproteobacteria bacterium]|nr:MAG: hypothetical protein EP343_14525 [Deltaproteobacteria bacterium]
MFQRNTKSFMTKSNKSKDESQTTLAAETVEVHEESSQSDDASNSSVDASSSDEGNASKEEASEAEDAPSPSASTVATTLGFREWWNTPSPVSAWGRPDIVLQLVIVLGAMLVYLPNNNFGLYDCWEPHYAEAARMMIVRNDWLHPFWSYAYFLSKPILMFWYMAASMSVFGVNEWAIRLPFSLHAVFMIWAVYFFVSRLFSTRAGVFAAIVVGTSPLTTFLGRQAMADILVVSYLTAGLGFFALAVFGSREEREAAIAEGRNPRVHLPYLYFFYFLMGLTLLAKGLLGAGLGGVAIVGYLLLSNDWHLLLRVRLVSGIALTLLVALPWYLHMLTFPGRNIDDGKDFFKRFILHDNFNRVFKGVHGDRGHFVYFVRQMGYSLGLWVGIVPFAAMAMGKWKQAQPDHNEKLKRFLFAWWFFFLVFFSLSQTKFHHYVFPLVPISGILVGIWLDKFLTHDRNPIYDLTMLLAALVFLVVIRDVLKNPHHLVNLFVYKYSRAYPWHDPMYLFGIDWTFKSLKLPFFTIYFKQMVAPFTPQNIIGFFTFSAFAFYLLSVLRFFTRKYVVHGLMALGIVWTVYYGQHWMPALSKHWSQKGMFESLKKDSKEWKKLLSDKFSNALKEDNPSEPLFAFRMNWRGEKFYSLNRDIQIMGRNSYTRMHDALTRLRKPGKPVYFLIESSRKKELKRALGYYDSRRLVIVDGSNHKYLLMKVKPKPPKEYQSKYQLSLDARTRRRYDDWNIKRKKKKRKKTKRKRLQRRYGKKARRTKRTRLKARSLRSKWMKRRQQRLAKHRKRRMLKRWKKALESRKQKSKPRNVSTSPTRRAPTSPAVRVPPVGPTLPKVRLNPSAPRVRPASQPAK